MWTLLIIAVVVDFLAAFFLALFYPGYSHMEMSMSVLGCVKSPVRIIYNIWLVILGVLMILSGILFYKTYYETSGILAAAGAVICIMYGIGGCILSGIFSVNETKELESLPEKIHGISAGTGFMALAFMPLIIGLISIKRQSLLTGVISLIFLRQAYCFLQYLLCRKKNLLRGP
ncbi:DUF998 domain-containing protein [Brucepastera parasyntrophica]|uniref:DUF998 domain-containing protein n=1 Tax=Brucepastera parasyntrophica TaxID=2880008 RepID=UPI00210F080F|nr:DUF998 domain-containing protein [Brucepastera parasyntrophica]ULQ58673.1 DUF998 domain-containing protein [Brucepastera parasyntrophica]